MPDYNSYKNDFEYKERFNPNLNWGSILFQPNSPLQSADLNDLQSLIESEQNQILGTIFSDGYILDGLIPIKLKINKDSIEYKISSGHIYFRGKVLYVKESSNISIPVKTDLIVNVKIDERVVEENSDSHILPDSIIGLKGTKKLIRIGYLTLDNGDISIFNSSKGDLIKSKDLNLNLNSKIETFIYDRFNNFLVKGFSTSLINIQLDKPVINSLVNTDLIQELKNIKDKKALVEVRISDTTRVINSLSNEDSILKEELNSRKLILESELSIINNQFNALNKELSDFYLLNSQESNNSLIYKLQISPGVAYVLGKRVEYQFIKSLSLKTNYKEILVENAVFNYSNVEGKEIISLVSSNKETKSNLIVIFYIEDINYLGEIYDIKIEFSLTANQDNLALINEFSSKLNSLEELQLLNITSSTHTDLNKYFLASIVYESISLKNESSNLLISNKTNNAIGITIEGDINFSSNSLLIKESSFSSINLAYEVTNIKRVVADRLKEDRLVIRQRDKDYLGEDSVKKVLDVYQGNKRFINNLDYILNDNSYITWISNNKPDLNSSYYASFIYTESLSELDYSLIGNKLFLNGKKPYALGSIYIDYYYLPEAKAILFLDKNGDINYSVSNRELKSSFPLITSNYLEIAKLELKLDTVIIYPTNNYIISNLDINLLVNRLKKLELKSQIIDFDRLIYNFNYINSSLIDFNKSNFAFNSNTGYITRNTNHINYLIKDSFSLKQLDSIKEKVIEQNLLTSNLTLFTSNEDNSNFYKNIKILNRVLRIEKSKSPFNSYDYILSDIEDSKTYIYQNYEELSQEVNREGLSIYSIDTNSIDSYLESHIYYLDIEINNIQPYLGSLKFKLDSSFLVKIEYLSEGIKLSEFICQASSKGQIKGRLKIEIAKPKSYKLHLEQNSNIVAVGDFILRDPKLDNFITDLNFSWNLNNNYFINSDYQFIYSSINREETILAPNLIQDFIVTEEVDITEIIINTIPFNIKENDCITLEIVKYEDPLSYKSLIQTTANYDSINSVWIVNFSPVKLERNIKYSLLIKVPPEKTLQVGIASLLERDYYNNSQIFYFNNLIVGKLYISENLNSYRELIDTQLCFSISGIRNLEFNNEWQEIYNLTFAKTINHFCLNELFSLIYPSFNKYSYQTEELNWVEFNPNQVISIKPSNKIIIQLQLNSYSLNSYCYFEKESTSLSTYSENNSYNLYTKELSLKADSFLVLEVISKTPNSYSVDLYNPQLNSLTLFSLEELDSEISLYKLIYKLPLTLVNPFNIEDYSFNLNIKSSGTNESLIKHIFILEEKS